MRTAPFPYSPYCNSLTDYSRFKTRVVKVGDLGIGGDNPIRIQSMTTTDTLNTKATVEQSIRMIEAGCELVRITAPSLKEAVNLENIRNELRRQGFNTPLVADIHFTPNAAEWAARIVEKVRINPGNYADKKTFTVHDYTDASYDAELERIRQRFTPLIHVCKEYGTALRIGTNHGSLSDRILSRYGDTPLGMVESALEFLRICEQNSYFNIVLSMKASNPLVMVEAYRLLVQKMMACGMNYPLHLGVTEAGEGEDGRIKSAVGIGTLLEDGLGDTIRVSLTEEPEFEIPVAKVISGRYEQRLKLKRETPGTEIPGREITLPYSPFEYLRRSTREVLNLGGHNVPRVVGDFSRKGILSPSAFYSVGYNYSVTLDKWYLRDQACDFIYTGKQILNFEIPGTLGIIIDHEAWAASPGKASHYPLFKGSEFFSAKEKSAELNFVLVSADTLMNDPGFDISRLGKNSVLILESQNDQGMTEQRRAITQLMMQNCDVPVILKRTYSGITTEQLLLWSATDLGALFVDGMGDGIWIDANGITSENNINTGAFGILQATRTRISKTEYISCPSCGRTLFDLQETTARIRSRTDHLKGVKIGIMGCIVNGPGEMADADYGYVGTGIGKITLYKGKEVVRKNIPADEAVDALISLMKEHGDWIEAPMNQSPSLSM